MKKRISSFDKNYKPGSLSVFPQTRDSKHSLYEASNNTYTFLKHGITPTSKYLIVQNTNDFPENGLLRISSPSGKGAAEVIYYGAKVKDQFHYLQRGFGGHPIFAWPAGSMISYPIMSEHHNTLKDAIINIQNKLGLIENPSPNSINGMLKSMEERWLSPKARFRCWPRIGRPPLTIKFKNFSSGESLKFLWDFGDGTTSSEVDPSHTYFSEGNYTIKLTIISNTGAHAITEKTSYISIGDLEQNALFYGRPLQGTSRITSHEDATEFEFVDQTDGNILERHWFFDDGTEKLVDDPNQHTIKHKYDAPGTYKPTLLIRLDNEQLLKINISEEVMVL